MRRWIPMVLVLAGCANGKSVALVTVDGQASGIGAFAVTVTLGGARSQVALITPDHAPVTLPPAEHLALTFDADKQGTATVHVDAIGAAGVIASGDSMPFTITPSQEVDVSVSLGGELPGDMGGPPRPDMPLVDLAMPDLAMPDLEMPDLTTLPAPTLSAAAPAKGSSAGGPMDGLTLTGTNFVQGAKVTVGGLDAMAKWVSATQMTATVPQNPGALGPVPVVVRNPDGQSATRNDLFAYYAGKLSFNAGMIIPFVPDGGADNWWQVVAGDYDGNGTIDIASSEGTFVGLFLGKGDGTFAQPKNPAVGLGNGYGLAAGDFNGDQKLDFVVANDPSAQVGIYLGNGDGTLQARAGTGGLSHPIWPAVGDFNGDQKLDLVVADDSSGAAVLLGKGDGTFMASTHYAAGSRPYYVLTADFNGDKKLDLAVGPRGSLSIYVLLGKGDGTFLPANAFAISANNNSSPEFLAAGDLDNDGAIDLVASNGGATGVGILLNKNDKSGGFKPYTTVNANGPTEGAALSDLDGDGNLDLSVLDAGGITVMLGKGDGTFQVSMDQIKPPVCSATNANSLLSADFNADGRPDLACAFDGVVLNTSQ
jgi:hypothetical protein